MSLQFILGGSGRGKTYYLQHLILKEAKKNPDKNYIMVVPEQFTMATQKEMVLLSEEKGILNIDVQSFLRLAFRVFSETGAGREPVLDDMGKTMILKKVLLNEEERLQYFGRNIRKKGYVSEIKSFLSELLQYGVNQEELREMMETAKGRPVLVKKLQDMEVAYEAFLRYIQDHYITSEEVFTVFADVVRKSELLHGSVLCLDGFTGFTPLQYRLLGELMKRAEKIYISVTLSAGESVVHPGEKHKLFYMSRKTIFHLRKLAQENRVEVCPEIWTDKEERMSRFEKAPALSVLEKNLFRFPFRPYKEKQSDISIHLLAQPENEVGFMVRQIQSLLRKENCRYRDIAVVTGDLGVYGVLAERAMNQAGIACFVDQKKSITANPFVEMFDALMGIMRKDFAYTDVIRYLKAKFSGFEREEVDVLDNFLIATGIRGHKKYQEEWTGGFVYRGKSEELIEETEQMLNQTRIKMMEKLLPLYEKTRGKHTVNEFCEIFLDFLEKEDFEHKIEEAVVSFREENELARAKEYEQIYEIVIGVFERLSELLGEEKMSLQEFKEILDTGFSEARIGLIPPAVDQIVVGDLSRTRISGVKYLFFLGVNDCNIPTSSGKGGILSETERSFLAEEEFELAPTSREAIYTEQFYLYLMLTKPSKHLYLTYCSVGNDGKARGASYLIDRICKIFPKLEIQREELRKDAEALLSNDKGKCYLIQGLRSGDYTDSKWRELYRYYGSRQETSEFLKDMLGAAFYRDEKSQISKLAANALYQEIFSGSTSQLERYAACAFSYFMRYGLHIEPRAEHRVEFFDIGNIVHDALQKYTEHLLEQGKRWEELSESEQHIQANLCLNEVVENYKNGLMYDTERDTYMISRLRKILARTVWAITEQMKAGKFETVESEFGFSLLEEGKVTWVDGEVASREDKNSWVDGEVASREDKNSLGDGEATSREDKNSLGDGESSVEEDKLVLEETETMRLIGRIDRVDAMEEKDACYIKIVDYKTGKKELSLSDLYHGLQMQLIIYLKAGMSKMTAKKKDKRIVIPAGVFYFNIEDPIIEGKMSQEKVEQAILKSLMLRGYTNEDNPVLPSMDSVFETESGELPLSQSSSVISVETDKNGALKKRSATLVTSQFEALMNYAKQKQLSMANEIMNGNTEVNPYKRMDASGRKACDYCPYHGVCHFDVKLPGNQYRSLNKMSDDDVFREITKEGGEEKDGESVDR